MLSPTTPRVAILDYGLGNLFSVKHACEHAGMAGNVTCSGEQILNADAVILPGMGAFGDSMRSLERLDLISPLRDFVAAGKPLVGVCLGMQLLCKHSEENDTECLGIFNESVKRFESKPGFKVPHMGWNQLALSNGWLHQSLDNKNVYFVHSYYVPVNSNTSAITEYTVPFSAAMHQKNFYAVQFHPEKSAEAGEVVLKSFLSL